MWAQKNARKSEGLRTFLVSFGSGGWIRTNDLRVMSPTSYQAAPPRINVERYYGVAGNESREIVSVENSVLGFRSTWVM
jgi:hypothetical protein